MAIIDRRRGGERRKVPRYAADIEIEWEDAKGRKKGTVSDISTEGCFVLCSGEVEDGEKVSLFFSIGSGMKVKFRAEVANHFYEIGFGARFLDLSKTQKSFLEEFIKKLS
jgi:hypothetical protein